MKRILRNIPRVTLPIWTWVILLGLTSGLLSACQTQSESLALAGPGEEEVSEGEDFLDGMVDLRNMLPIIHICGTHMVFEAGGYVLDRNGNRFNSSLEPENMMNFVAASNETLARQILARFLK